MTDLASHRDGPVAAANLGSGPRTRGGESPFDLAELRTELDRIDDALHDLFMQRATVVEKVARSGKRSAFRPGREAIILRRLVARHDGALSPEVVFRIWRELLSGTTSMQTRLVAAVFDPADAGAIAELAKEHFSRAVVVHRHDDFASTLAELQSKQANLAVVPVPADGDQWWTALLDAEPAVHVIARLPFWSQEPRVSAAVPARSAQAFVLGTEPPDPSGRDRSILGVRLADGMQPEDLLTALAAARCNPGLLAASGGHALFEIAGYQLAETRPPVPALRPCRWRLLGAYAEPIRVTE